MKAFYLIYLLFIYPSLLYAEVVTDGSLGARVELSGKNFEITPELGKQMDHNLFHSFDKFSLQADESATFSGPSQIQNIIARVTGGNPSNIDGTLRSTIPEADLYLINPYGILFGKDAKLDLQGGFHATTADELRFQDGSVFNARTPQQAALLSVAPIQAFGFLTDTPAAIQLQDSHLNVLDTHTLSLIGGDLNLKGDFLKDAQGERVANGTVHVFKFPTYAYTAELKTNAGRINLASIGSRGEVILSDTDLTINAAQLGNITLDHAEVQTSGAGNGQIFIRGRDLTLQSGKITNSVNGAQGGGLIDIQARNILLTGGVTDARIASETTSSGRGGEIQIVADNLEIAGGGISTSVYSTGRGGNIIVRVKDKLNLHDPNPELVKYNSIYSDLYNAGDSGSIDVEAGQIEIHAISSIAARTYALKNFNIVKSISYMQKIHGICDINFLTTY